ncbi:hypothetical protein BpHYR1_018849 [Brachionus plicatilis]|uniref:Secreted protein n=1 Tax=Brachionus plicatilis TaxID=10195 RepID=A0A3M7RUZ3_BRAPC|nr:hypothetical protein BpHYR1_018849 [Brachionus plicatilis]
MNLIIIIIIKFLNLLQIILAKLSKNSLSLIVQEQSRFVLSWYITVNSALKVGLRFSCVVKPKLYTLTAVKLYAFMTIRNLKKSD